MNVILWSFGDDDFLAYTLKWWILFVELNRQEFMWFIWLMMLSDELMLMPWLEIEYACYTMIELW